LEHLIIISNYYKEMTVQFKYYHGILYVIEVLVKRDNIRTVTTSHGADIIPFSNQHVADIQCCSNGINRIFASVRTAIDVQGQSSQVIQLNEKGEVVNFIISEMCASGIGRGLAEKCVEEGIKVVLADIDEDTLNQAEKNLKATGAEVMAVLTDVLKLQEVENLAAKTLETFRSVDLLFNNAGRYLLTWSRPDVGINTTRLAMGHGPAPSFVVNLLLPENRSKTP
jgi:activator of 2-hydroxyglutaryl-CoA dehydratase